MVIHNNTPLNKIYILTDYERTSLEKILPLVNLMPHERIEKFKRYPKNHQKLNCFLGYFLLAFALKKNNLLKDLPSFFYGENNKPFLKNYEKIFFSLSHTKNAIAVFISSSPVGIDIEKVRPVSKNLMKKVCSNLELFKIFCSPNKEKSFFKVWTKKESFCKLKGKSLFSSLNSLKTTDFKNTRSFFLSNFILSYSSFFGDIPSVEYLKFLDLFEFLRFCCF